MLNCKSSIAKYVASFFAYFLFWMLFFTVTRSVFFLFQWRAMTQLSVAEVASCYLHGWHMDASFAGYLSVAFAAIIAVSGSLSSRVARRIIWWYTMVILFVLTALSVVDSELFTYWGFRLDTSPLIYLKNPREAMASIPVLRTLLLIVFAVLWFFGNKWAYNHTVHRMLNIEKRMAWWGIPIFLILAGLCIVPIRGSLGTSPMNHGMIFFSQKEFANQAALNMPWNLMHAITHQDRFREYRFMPSEEAQKVANDFFEHDTTEMQQVLSTTRPNVIVLLLESLSALFVERLGGESGVTPCFNQLVDEGLFFTNIYADGHRTERGLVAALSGYPSQTRMPVISSNTKMPKLPFISRDLKAQGYSTAFYYGGDISFVNMRGYLLTAGFDRYTSGADYPREQHSPWGAHDEYLYADMLKGLDAEHQPFLYAALTMSNHEPHEVPMPTVFEGADGVSKFKNSAYYADKCLGDFIAECKTKPWWDSTLVILISDHGLRLYPDMSNAEPRRYHIPMLWLGGALNVKSTLSKIGNQRDLAATLLAQMGMDIEPYKFSSNLLSAHKKDFALYTFPDGFGFVLDSAALAYDNNAQRVVINVNADSLMLHQAKALFQVTNDDFLGL